MEFALPVRLRPEHLFFFGRVALPTPRYAQNCRDYVIATTPHYVDLIRNVVQRVDA